MNSAQVLSLGALAGRVPAYDSKHERNEGFLFSLEYARGSRIGIRAALGSGYFGNGFSGSAG